MYSINDEQIDFILNDIRRRGVEMEDLQYNLLDHICCIVEQNLESGGNFEDFYNQTISKFFKHELWEIEEETILLLTYKNYYTMKKAMIYGGVISLSLIALGTVLKIFHWPGAAPSLLLGFFMLCFVFFPSALYLNYSSSKKGLGINLTAFTGGTIFILGVLFKVMHWPGSSPLLILGSFTLLGIFTPLLLFSTIREQIPSKKKIIYTIGALGIIMFGSAILFKIMHWPGTGPLLILGSFLLIVLFIPLYTNMQIKANKMNPGQFVFVITLSMYAVVLTSLLTMNISKHVLERFSRDEADNTHIVNYFEKKKQRLISEMANDSTQISQAENKKLISESANKVKELIHSLRIELVSFIEGVDKDIAQQLLLHPNQIMRQDNYDLVNTVLLAEQGTNKASMLKAFIENYRSEVLKIASNNEQLVTKINILLNTDDKIIALDYKTSWEINNFYHNPLIGTLARLSDIEKNICLIETEVLTLKN
jgi:hypothetical protein